MLEMAVNVLDMHQYVLAHFVGAWRPKLGTLAAQHQSAFPDVQLCMSDAAIRSHMTEALLEPEGVAQPGDRFGDVFVDENGTTVARGAERLTTMSSPFEGAGREESEPLRGSVAQTFRSASRFGSQA
jgi:hypothetical protein